MFGGLLAVLLVTQNAYAADSTSIKSQGVITFNDSTGKSVKFDSSDLVNLKSDVAALDNKLNGLSEPTLKVTYHQHTDDCYTYAANSIDWCNIGLYQQLNEDFDYIASWPSTDGKTPTRRYQCLVCRATGPLIYAYKSTSTNTGQKDFAVGHDYLMYIPWTDYTFKHYEDCPFYRTYIYRTRSDGTKEGYYILTCGKTTDTIESVELVTN